MARQLMISPRPAPLQLLPTPRIHVLVRPDYSSLLAHGAQRLHKQTRTRTIVIFAVRPEEEGCALQWRARRAELLNLRNIRRERRGVLVRILGLGRVEISAHGGGSSRQAKSEWARDEWTVHGNARKRDGHARGRFGVAWFVGRFRVFEPAVVHATFARSDTPDAFLLDHHVYRSQHGERRSKRVRYEYG